MRGESQRDKSRGRARAAMFIQAELGWVGGAPVDLEVSFEGVSWVSLRGGRIEHRVIDRQTLSGSVRTIRALVDRFPRALPHVVGDVEAWRAARVRLVDTLKAGLHGRAPLPTDLFGCSSDASIRARAERLLAEHPALRVAAQLISWGCTFDERRMRRSLDWLETHSATFEAAQERLSVRDHEALVLALHRHFEAEGATRLAPLMACLANPAVYRLPRGLDPAAAKAVYDGMNHCRPRRPEALTLRPIEGLVETFVALAAANAAGRRRALRLPLRVRSPSDEWCSERALLYGRAYEALGRRRKAEAAYARPIERECWHDNGPAEARDRLAARGGAG